MTKKTILLMALVTLGAINIQASEGQIKREFTVTTIALDAQEAQDDTNETNLEGGNTKDK